MKGRCISYRGKPDGQIVENIPAKKCYSLEQNGFRNHVIRNGNFIYERR